MAGHLNEVYNDTGIADLPMLFGWNLYFGWYYETIEDLGRFLDDQHQRFPNRSIMISEYGPGADVRISANQPKTYDYSQQYQLKLHKSYYNQVQDRTFVAGMTAWNFADFGSEFRGESLPHINQKGLVQYNREPKEIYHWYQSVLLKDKPFVHIAKYQKDILLVNSDTLALTVFSNQKSADLFVNEVFVQQLNFQSGVATAKINVSTGITNVKVIKGSIEDSFDFNISVLKNLKTQPLKKLGINLGTHINFTNEVTNVTYLADRPYSDNLFGYVQSSGECKKQLISNNIKNSNLEGVYQTILTDCGLYKIDVPNGKYKVTLMFVEPKLKSKEQIIFNLKYEVEDKKDDKQRIFDVYINDTLIEKQLNLAQAYPEKYGVTLQTTIQTKKGLTLKLNAIEGLPVISGILIEKLD